MAPVVAAVVAAVVTPVTESVDDAPVNAPAVVAPVTVAAALALVRDITGMFGGGSLGGAIRILGSNKGGDGVFLAT